MKVKVVYNILILIISINIITSSEEWSGEKNFDDNYQMKWKKNDVREVMTFRIEVKTNGWIGFGISSHGFMIQSDMFIAWFDVTGKTIYHVLLFL